MLSVVPGITVAEAIIAAKLPFGLPCGGRGTCGGCAVKVITGSLSPPDVVEQAKLVRAPQGIRLACRARVTGPVTLRLPFAPPSSPRPLAHAPEALASVLAVDLGTTTVKVALASAAPGSQHITAAVRNRQSRYGADVLSRLSAANEGHAAQLRLDIQQSVSEAYQSLSASENGLADRIHRVVVVGNPVMLSLYCGQKPSHTGSSRPPQPLVTNKQSGPSELGVQCNPFGDKAETIFIPGVAGHVGGDLLAGLLMLGPTLSEPFIYVDIGTNSEIAVHDSSHIHVASVPAGPVFEGAGISSGGPFGPGAITKVGLKDGRIEVDVEGDGDPDRFCGSGLISLILALRSSGHIDESGRMWASGSLRSHFADVDGQPVFSIAPSGLGPWLTQSDVRAFQTAKAAILAAIRTMLSAADHKPDRLIVSGTFGGAVSAEELRELGVVPADLRQVDVIADAALLGAVRIAQAPQTITRLDALRALALHHELPQADEFTAQYIAAMKLSPSTG